MIGRGDWKAYRKGADNDLAATYEVQAKNLFTSSRMENRLATFENLTLPSLKAQSDQNFSFLVVSSDLMPAEYQDRLKNICEKAGQVALRFVPPMHISEAVRQYVAEDSPDLADFVQFRLDDDDCVSRDYVRRLRLHAAGMWRNTNFAISFPSIYYCVTDGPTKGIYRWYNPFLGVGVAVRHKRRTVFEFAHYRIPRRVVAITDPHFPCIVTHAGDNDTPRHDAATLRKRGMQKVNDRVLLRDIRRHFSFLGEKGLRLATLPPPAP